MGIKELFSRNKKPQSTIQAQDILKASFPGLSNGFNGSKFQGAIPYETMMDGDENIDFEQARAKSRKQYTQNTIAHTVIETKVNSTMHSGMTLEAKPKKRILESYNIKVDKDWDKLVEARFDLWASTKGSDYNFKSNFYQQETEAFRQHLLDGEVLAIPRYIPSPNRGRIGRLNTQLVKVDQLKTPLDQINQNIINGKKLDDKGTVIGYYFVNKKKGKPDKSVYIPRWGEKTGRLNVINPIRSNSIGMINGTPDLTPILHDLDAIGKYEVAELQAAVVNATIALIQNSDGQNPNPKMDMGGAKRKIDTTNEDGSVNSEMQVTSPLPGLQLYATETGQSLSSYDTKRPNVNFAQFRSAIAQTISASVGIPIENLEKKFSSNYSASRAALLEFWRYVTFERKNWQWDFCQPIFDLWLADEIAFGRIKADGWNHSDIQIRGIIRKAWSCSEWHGVAKGNIDPLKEMKAAAFAEDRGWKTAELNSRELFGLNFDNNYDRRLDEVEKQRKTAVGEPSDYMVDGEQFSSDEEDE